MKINYFLSKNTKTKEKSGVFLFCVVGDEIYFLPHFLEFYRNIGIKSFYFLVDHSTDGTLEYLQSQEDCAIFLTDNKFSQRVNFVYQGKRYSQSTGTFWKTLIPRRHLRNRWVLVVDADEFIQLPSDCEKIHDLTAVLDKNNKNCCRALMIDFFPELLSDTARFDIHASPFSVSQFYDPIDVEWKDEAMQPYFINTDKIVRNRIVDKIIAENPLNSEELNSQKIKWQFKTPLLKFNQRTLHIDAHRTNHKPSSEVQCVLAHFKFYPHWEKKVASTLERKSHYLGSLKYQPLGFAKIHLQNWNLLSPHSLKYSSKRDLENNNLIFNKLK